MSAVLAARLDGAEPGVEALLQARALHYGDGVFRTALVADGAIHDEARQIALLQRDAARLELDVDATAVQREARGLASGRGRCVLKLLVWRTAAARGYRSDTRQSHRLLTLHELPRWPASNWERGVVVDIAPLPLALQPRLAGVKHLNRLEQVLASRDWPVGIDERLMLDTYGRVIAGTRTNLFWVRSGALHTPGLDECGVAGAMRERVLQAAERGRTRALVGAADLAELERADELFLTNSLVGIWPVRSLGATVWRQPGPVTRALQQAIDHPAVSG